MTERPTHDVVRLRIPLKSEYLSVLRATAAAIAGSMDFNYDEVIQIRIAVSEVFDMALEHTGRVGSSEDVIDLPIEFVIGEDILEFQISYPVQRTEALDREQNEETHAILHSLMDTVDFSVDDAIVHMTKRRTNNDSAENSQRE